MDVTAIRNSEGSTSAAASPVVPAAPPEPVKPAKPEKNPVAEKVKRDIVEFSQGSQRPAAESPFVVHNSKNVRSGSRVFHDDATNQFVVQILNDSNEVIRQLPSEDALRIANRFRRITGLLFDQSA
jgi:flagellar protein FlaG